MTIPGVYVRLECLCLRILPANRLPLEVQVLDSGALRMQEPYVGWKKPWAGVTLAPEGMAECPVQALLRPTPKGASRSALAGVVIPGAACWRPDWCFVRSS